MRNTLWIHGSDVEIQRSLNRVIAIIALYYLVNDAIQIGIFDNTPAEKVAHATGLIVIMFAIFCVYSFQSRIAAIFLLLDATWSAAISIFAVQSIGILIALPIVLTYLSLVSAIAAFKLRRAKTQNRAL